MAFFVSLQYRLERLRIKRDRFLRSLKYFAYILLVLMLIDAGFIWGLLPDWNHYEKGPVQKSSFIKTYEYRRAKDPGLPGLRWQPVGLSKISKKLIRAVIVAEDARFYQHQGIDTEALKDAMEYNLSNVTIGYGGSTISQQMIKNMLLTPSRNPLRKWHELWLTIDLERHVSKKRILEIYLNVAEFGKGIYGVESAAQYYFNKSASRLNMRESIDLAASLTSPVRHNPGTRTDYFLSQQKKIKNNLGL